MTRIISKAELSRWAGISRTAVSRVCRKQLLEATTDKGVDVDHPLARDWLAGHGVSELPTQPVPPKAIAKKTAPAPRRKAATPTKKKAKAKSRPPAAKTKKPKKPVASRMAKAKVPAAAVEKPKKPSAVLVAMTHQGEITLDDIGHLTLKEIVFKFGGIDGFKRYVDALKSIADFQFREQKIRQGRGELIERSLVRNSVMPLIDVAYGRLVTDVPITVAQLVIARVKSGGADTVIDVQKLIRDGNSQVLKNTKKTVLGSEVWRDVG